MSDVPQGTIAEVLDWVGDDPDRAQAALDAERNDQNRSTLIDRLENIATAKEEEPVTETNDTTEEQAEDQPAPAPEPPTEIELYPADAGTVIGPVSVRDPDVDAEDVTAGLDEDEAISAEQVESVQGVSGTHGAVVVINGTAYAFNTDMVGALKQAVDRAVVGLSF